MLAVLFVPAYLAAPRCLAQNCAAWSEVAQTGPGYRFLHGMAYDTARGVTVLFGGWEGGDPFGDTWEWSGSQWAHITDTGPAPRYMHAMAHDSSRHVSMIFGGWDRSIRYGDTWQWDGARWELAADTGPSARFGCSMAYDARRGRMVLFGGTDGENRYFNDTWEWDGAAWQLVSESGPPPRQHAGMAYDAARGGMVLFGGTANRDVYGDTWEWDGSEWEQVATSGPPRRWGPAMTYDATWDTVTMYGGTGDNRFDDTWEWNGVQWRQVAQAGPGGRTYPRMVHDDLRGVITLFGGSDLVFNRGTWEWQVRTRIAAQPQDVHVPTGQSAEFTIGVAGQGQWTYQWRLDDQPLSDNGHFSGATTDTLTIDSVSCDDTGAYDCVVTAECGNITSDSAALTTGGDVRLSVVATCPDGGPIAISWRCASPGGQAALVFALGQGQFRIPPTHPCADTWLGLSSRGIQLVWTGGAGAQGRATLNAVTGPNACGGYLQLLDLSTCTPSDTARIE